MQDQCQHDHLQHRQDTQCRLMLRISSDPFENDLAAITLRTVFVKNLGLVRALVLGKRFHLAYTVTLAASVLEFHKVGWLAGCKRAFLRSISSFSTSKVLLGKITWPTGTSWAFGIVGTTMSSNSRPLGRSRSHGLSVPQLFEISPVLVSRI